MHITILRLLKYILICISNSLHSIYYIIHTGIYFTMGIRDLLPHLPGGETAKYLYDFNELDMNKEAVAFDVAGALWECASNYPVDYLGGNHDPALTDVAHLIQNLRSICEWKMVVWLDGMENAAKGPEIARRKARSIAAKVRNDLRGQIKNTPEYIAKARVLFQFLNVKTGVAAYEADPQVAYESITRHLTVVTGDSDLLAYGVNEKLIVVSSYKTQKYRVIDLNADVQPGEYPLLDLYHKYGCIVFQLYAACRGCDFTAAPSGISGVGYEMFIELAEQIEGGLTAKSFALSLWNNKKDIAERNNFTAVGDVEDYMQSIVDVYALGLVYDEQSNIIDMTGKRVVEYTSQSLRHMRGEVDSRTGDEHGEELLQYLRGMDCSQFIAKTAADTSTIRGVHLPNDLTPSQCNVSTLRDFLAARGGTISMAKDELVTAARCHQFLERQVPRKYVDRNPDRNGLYYKNINTSSTRSIGQILHDLASGVSTIPSGTSLVHDLIREAHELYNQGLFDDQYDNIARVAPELKPGFIYTQFGHIGASKEEKNIGDALRRCFYDNETTYHALAFVPGTNRVIILSKCHASMARDEKTRNSTDEGEPPKKKEYLLIMELFYDKTIDIEVGHNLGIFTHMGRSYCTACIAGFGNCRHRSERLWYQYHHWTDERLGIDRPTTLLACSWAKGGKPLVCDVRAKIYAQQTVKMEMTIEKQTAKIQRGVKRDCTEGTSCAYQVHLSSKKQVKQSKRFTKERCKKLFDLLRNES